MSLSLIEKASGCSAQTVAKLQEPLGSVGNAAGAGHKNVTLKMALKQHLTHGFQSKTCVFAVVSSYFFGGPYTLKVVIQRVIIQQGSSKTESYGVDITKYFSCIILNYTGGSSNYIYPYIYLYILYNTCTCIKKKKNV